jgi:putative ABC transport system substrate-binding protein
MTGTVGGYDWKTRLKLLLLLRPDISHVIVPYTPPFDGDHIEMEKIEATLHEYGITVKSIPLEHNSDVPQKIAPFLHEAGALLALRDAVVLVAREQIIKKCNQHSVTIFAADMESVETGAAAALCITEAEMGIYPARQTIDILINKKSPGNVPLIDVGDNGSRFIINEKGLKRQGGEIDKNLLFLIKKANIVRNNTRKV